MSAHALMSASKMSIWEQCAGAPALWERLTPEEQSSTYAQEGTLAHAIAEEVLNGEFSSASEAIASRDISVDKDFEAAVSYYVDYVYDLLDRNGLLDSFRLNIEQSVSLKRIGFPDHYGTIDCCIVSPAKANKVGRIYIVDYKHGAGVPVFVQSDDFRMNRQLMYYLLGAVVSLLPNMLCNIAPRTGEEILSDKGKAFFDILKEFLEKEFPELQIHIVQPRIATRYSMAEVSIDQLIDFYKEFIAAVEKSNHQRNCSTDSLHLTVGDWCRWCSVRDMCPARLRQIIAEAQEDFDMIEDLDDVQSLDTSQLSDLLLRAEKVERMIQQLRANAEARLRSGESIPEFSLINKRATKKWNNEGAVISLLQQMEIDPFKYMSLPSPTTLMKQLPKSFSTALNDYIVSVSSGTRLGKRNDKT